MEKTLKQRYEELAEEYRQALIKQFYPDEEVPYVDSYWVGDEIGGMLELNEDFFDFDNIRYIVDNNIKYDEWREWYDYCTTLGLICREIPTPNFEHWCLGYPRKSSKEIEDLRKAHERVLRAKKDLEEMIEKQKDKHL